MHGLKSRLLAVVGAAMTGFFAPRAVTGSRRRYKQEPWKTRPDPLFNRRARNLLARNDSLRLAPAKKGTPPGKRWKRRNENWFGLNPKHKRSRGGMLHGAFTHKLTEQPLQK